jgi:predicted RecB family nuclease
MLDLKLPKFFTIAPCAAEEFREVFFSRKPTEQRVAVQVCKTCPFLDECREQLASGQYGEYGVVAGYTPAERRRM